MTGFFFWLGALAILALLGSELGRRAAPFFQAWRRKRAVKKAEKLDWQWIDNTLNSDRPRRDCERQESLGICTGRECLVYETCDFNIKKVVH